MLSKLKLARERETKDEDMEEIVDRRPHHVLGKAQGKFAWGRVLVHFRPMMFYGGTAS